MFYLSIVIISMIALLVFLTFILNLSKPDKQKKRVLKLVLISSMTSIFIISSAVYLGDEMNTVEFLTLLLLSMFFIGIYNKKISQQVTAKYNTTRIYFKRSKKDIERDSHGIEKTPWVPYNPLAGFLSLF